MDLTEAMRQRHSVRRYLDRPLDPDVKDRLDAFARQCSRESGLHIQLICNEPAGFGKTFPGADNYFALVGPRSADLEEKCGYQGERLVLFAQQLGLNTCWAMLSKARKAAAYLLEDGEVFVIAIAVGYGADSGKERKSKSFEDVTKLTGEAPEWFRKGVEAALLAPTAMNQQAFVLELLPDGAVRARPKLRPLAHLDLGIVKYHFEIGAGTENFRWAR